MSVIQGLLDLLKVTDGISDNLVRALKPVLDNPAIDNLLTDAVHNADLSNIDNILDDILHNAARTDGLTRQAQEFLTGLSFKNTVKIYANQTQFTDEVLAQVNSGAAVNIENISKKYTDISPEVIAKAQDDLAERETSIRGLAADFMRTENMGHDVAHETARTVWAHRKAQDLAGEALTGNAGRNANNADATPTPEPAPSSGASTADEGAGVADDADNVNGARDPNEFPRDSNGNPSSSTADMADDLGTKTGDGYTVPPSRSRMASAAQWAWDNTAGRVVNPVGRFVHDVAAVTMAMPNYIRRMTSWRFSDNAYTKDLFAKMDTHKTTNTARLSVLINPEKQALHTGNAGNYIYTVEKSTDAADNLTGSMHNVETTLKNTSASVANEVNTMANTLDEASVALADAARQIELARTTESSIIELRHIADTFRHQSQTYVTGTLNRIPLDEMSEQLGLHIRNTTDSETLDALKIAQESVVGLQNASAKNAELTEQAFKIYTDATGASKKIPLDEMSEKLSLRIQDATDPETLDALKIAQDSIAELQSASMANAEFAAQASKIYGDLSLIFIAKADETSQAVTRMTSAADDTLRARMTTIKNMGENSDGLFDDISAAAERLSNDVERINNSLADMAAPPPSNKTDRLVGGTVVARLAAHDAAPYMARISTFSDNVSSLSNDLQHSLDLTHVERGLEDVLNTSDSNKANNLLQLSEDLANRAAALREGSVERLDNVLNNYTNANTALREMDDVVETYTRETDDINSGLFSKNTDAGKANTNFALEQDVGRIEREMTSADRRRFRALVEEQEIRIDFVKGQTLDDIIEYVPGETPFNITSSNGNAAHMQRSDEEKFLEYALVFQRATGNIDETTGKMVVSIDRQGALNKALTAAEDLLTTDNENRYWEAIKWSMLGYARNPTTGGVTDLARDSMLAELLVMMRKRAAGLVATDGRQGPFSDRVLHATQKAIGAIDAIGANSYREAWVDTWNRTRNIRFPQDFANEMTSDIAFERGMAQNWDTGFGPTGRIGMDNTFLRMAAVGPKAIWDNFPYRKTHFGTAKAAAITTTKIAMTTGTVWWLGSTAKNYFFDEDEEKQDRTPPTDGAPPSFLAIPLKIAEDIDDARDLSEDNIELIVEQIDDINGLYGEMFTNMRTVFDDNIAKLDSLILIQESLNTDEGREKAGKYNELKTQVQDTFQAYSEQLQLDQAQLGTGAEISRLAVIRLDGLIQATPDLHIDVANDLLKQQNGLRNALEANSSMALKNGMADVNSMINQLDAAINSGEPLATLPLPSQLNTLTPAEVTAEEARIAEATRIAAAAAATLALQNAKDANDAAQAALTADPDNAALQAAAVKAQADFDLLNVEEITRLKAAEDARIAAAAKADADAKAAETTRLAGLTSAQRTAEAAAVETAARAADPLYDEHKDAAASLAEATAFSTRIGKLHGSDTATNTAAFLVAGMKTQQADKIVKLSEEMFDKGDHNAVASLNELLANVNGNNRAAADVLEQLATNQASATALQTQVNGLNTQIQGITALSGKGDAQGLLTTLQGKTDALKDIKEDSETLHKQIEQLVSDNAALIQANPEAKHHFGTGGIFEKGAIAAGGGEYGLLNQFLGSTAGGTSVIGGYFNMASSKIKDGMDWWSEAKRGARTQGEMNGYNLAEQGFLAFMSIVALNKIGEWTGMSKGVKIAALIGIIGYFIHRSGATGQDMRDHADARHPFAQVDPTLRGRNNLPNSAQRNTSTSTGNTNTTTVEDKVVTLTDRNGNPVTHQLPSSNQRNVTVQGANGGVPQNVVDIATARNAKDAADKTVSTGQGNGNNIVNFENRTDTMRLVANGETPAGTDNLITFPEADGNDRSLETQSVASN